MLSRFSIFSQHGIRPPGAKDVKAPHIPQKRHIVAPQVLERKTINFDWNVTEFEIRVAVSASILIFSMGMLATQRGEPGMYLPLITSVLGYWTPSPTKK